ncbi:MAG TPA: glycoside hydrolase family 88 protein [Acidobacteriaceae bacterium]|jgi:rhamnogalacturonyl hydrolase YesR|nr:glycoside hydrolase family 88 protein [Acidobacteriaceae bacterium]
MPARSRQNLLHSGLAALLITLSINTVCAAQTASTTPRPSAKELHDAAGDIAANPGAIDASLSPALTHRDVRRTMKKVADWELAHAQSKFTQDWTYAPLYSGLLAASHTLNDRRYHDAVLAAAERFHWQLLPGRPFHADDEAIGQAYEELYAEKHDPLRIAAVRANFAQVMARPDDPAKDLWWWCDALYMAPPSLAKLSQLTGDDAYLTFMEHEWSLTQSHLYNPTEHLFFRDASFFDKKEPNGQPLFWSRGNGWVLAGTARVLAAMPKDDPERLQFEKLFRDMAERVADLQPRDGLWRMGLLDPDAYPQGEISGTAFFTYAMAWGVNNHLLPASRFRPVIEKAWAGMLQHIYTDGRLGAIQPIGAAPGELQPGSTWAYGVGGFLLAGSEIDRGLSAHTLR